MSKHPPRKIHGEFDADLIARDAWAKMKRGVSLADCAYHARLHVSEMDLIIWRWCCDGRGKAPAVVETPTPLAPRRFSWQ